MLEARDDVRGLTFVRNHAVGGRGRVLYHRPPFLTRQRLQPTFPTTGLVPVHDTCAARGNPPPPAIPGSAKGNALRVSRHFTAGGSRCEERCCPPAPTASARTYRARDAQARRLCVPQPPCLRLANAGPGWPGPVSLPPPPAIAKVDATALAPVRTCARRSSAAASRTRRPGADDRVRLFALDPPTPPSSSCARLRVSRPSAARRSVCISNRGAGGDAMSTGESLAANGVGAGPLYVRRPPICGRTFERHGIVPLL